MDSGVPGLVPAHCWVEPGLSVSGCRVLGVLEPVLVHWCVALDLMPSGGQSQVQR